MSYKYIDIPENIREWINGLSGNGHMKENTFTNQERWLLGQSGSEMWEYIETNPYRICPVKERCPFKREHCLSGNVGYECRKVFMQWASRPISRHDGSRYLRDAADYQIKLEFNELKQAVAGQNAAMEEMQRQISQIAQSLKVADKLDLPVSELKLPIKTYNCLWRSGVSTLRNLCNMQSIRDLKAIRNLGKVGQAAVIERMRDMGFVSWADRMGPLPQRLAK